MKRERRIAFVDRLIHAFMFGALFIVIGYYLPKMASSYLPSSYYYNATITIIGKTQFKPCDTINYMVERNSRVSSNATFYDFLVYNNESEGGKIIWKYVGQGTIENTGEGRIFREIKIPCEAPIGAYSIRRQVAFEVDHHTKVYEYKSDPIKVTSD